MNKQHKDWASKLIYALWAYRTAFKVPLGFSPYQLVYGKMCHLPVEILHKADWAIRELNIELGHAKRDRLMKIEELQEWRRQAYDNSKLYKERLKAYHDKSIIAKEALKPGDKVLLFNSRLRLMPGKLRSRWMGPFEVVKVFYYGVAELKGDEGNFKANVQRLKLYLGNEHREVLSVAWVEDP